MFKATLMVASVTCMLGLITPQAHAAMSCTTEDMTKMDTSIAKLTDATKKSNAMKEMATARDMMAKKDMAACMTHMNTAATYLPANPG